MYMFVFCNLELSKRSLQTLLSLSANHSQGYFVACFVEPIAQSNCVLLQHRLFARYTMRSATENTNDKAEARAKFSPMASVRLSEGAKVALTNA